MENKIQENNSKHLYGWYIPTNEFYAQVINSLEDYAVLTMDKELIINSWNSGAQNIFGYEEKEILGRHFDIIFTKEDIKNKIPEQEAEMALKEGKSKDERWHLRKDNTKIYASGLVFPLNDAHGKHLGYVKVLRNITERKKSDEAIKNYVEELKELNLHKEKTLSVLSHDLRSPLAGIVRTTGLLKSEFNTFKPFEVKQMLTLLEESSKNLLGILDNLVEWARVKYATEIFSPEKIKLSDYVKEVFETLSENANEKRIALHNQVGKDIFVFADEKMLRSIVQNLVSNAIKYTNQKGQIIVSAKEKDDKIIVEVKDNGIGLPKEKLERIFVPKVESLTKEKEGKGAGIGLLLVKGFVEKNGGEVGVTSEEGRGATFYFTLPAIKEKDWEN